MIHPWPGVDHEACEDAPRRVCRHQKLIRAQRHVLHGSKKRGLSAYDSMAMKFDRDHLAGIPDIVEPGCFSMAMNFKS